MLTGKPPGENLLHEKSNFCGGIQTWKLVALCAEIPLVFLHKDQEHAEIFL